MKYLVELGFFRKFEKKPSNLLHHRKPKSDYGCSFDEQQGEGKSKENNLPQLRELTITIKERNFSVH